MVIYINNVQIVNLIINKLAATGAAAAAAVALTICFILFYLL